MDELNFSHLAFGGAAVHQRGAQAAMNAGVKGCGRKLRRFLVAARRKPRHSIRMPRRSVPAHRPRSRYPPSAAPTRRSATSRVRVRSWRRRRSRRGAAADYLCGTHAQRAVLVSRKSATAASPSELMLYTTDDSAEMLAATIHAGFFCFMSEFRMKGRRLGLAAC